MPIICSGVARLQLMVGPYWNHVNQIIHRWSHSLGNGHTFLRSCAISLLICNYSYYTFKSNKVHCNLLNTMDAWHYLLLFLQCNCTNSLLRYHICAWIAIYTLCSRSIYSTLSHFFLVPQFHKEIFHSITHHVTLSHSFKSLTSLHIFTSIMLESGNNFFDPTHRTTTWCWN